MSDPAEVRTVADLVAILQTLDQSLPIATYAMNSIYMAGVDRVSHGRLRVAILHTYGGNHVVIGNLWRRDINRPNWYVVREVDGGGAMKP